MELRSFNKGVGAITRLYFKENGKIIVQFSFTLLFIALGIWFLQHEHAELIEVKKVWLNANLFWVAIGVGLTALYILLQAMIYVYSFAVLKLKISLGAAMVLFV